MFRLTAFTDYVSPVDRANRDARRRKARFWREARKTERGERFMLRFRVPFLIVALALASVGWGCDEGDTIYNTACKPEKPHEWHWSESAALYDYAVSVTWACQQVTVVTDLYWHDTNPYPTHIVDWTSGPILRFSQWKLGEDCWDDYTPWYATSDPVLVSSGPGWGNQHWRWTYSAPRSSMPDLWAEGDAVGWHWNASTLNLLEGSSSTSPYVFDPRLCNAATESACPGGGCRDCPDPNGTPASVMSAPRGIREALLSLPADRIALFDEALNVSDAEAAEFAARMAPEFAELWRWYVKLAPEQRRDVLHFIRYQSALAGGEPYGWTAYDGSLRWTTSNGTSSISGLR